MYNKIAEIRTSVGGVLGIILAVVMLIIFFAFFVFAMLFWPTVIWLVAKLIIHVSGAAPLGFLWL